MTSNCPVDIDWARRVRKRADAGESRTPDKRLSKELLTDLPGCIVTDEIVQM
ncbi:hypothetical protein [Streptomyces sp. NPDC002779]|uniref:hypothetical protein n=1 Tax=Streptomyces sp. NPDC002779 TaxID=3364664 RepID=UPI0036A3F395